MKNEELLKKYPGISTRIHRIFAYHYDQIQWEVQTELSTLNPELQGQFMDLVLMKNEELLKKYASISTRIRRIFAYHYDQIQREVQTEISTLNPELQRQFMDLVIEYMEESINWPDPDDQETFEKQLLG